MPPSQVHKHSPLPLGYHLSLLAAAPPAHHPRSDSVHPEYHRGLLDFVPDRTFLLSTCRVMLANDVDWEKNLEAGEFEADEEPPAVEGGADT